MKAVLRILGVGLMLAFGAAIAQDDGAQTDMAGPGFSDLDVSGDAQLDQSDILNAGIFNAFDTDADGSVSASEFANHVFTRLDTDLSGSLSETELSGVSSWGSDLTMSEFDADGDGEVSQEDFTQLYDVSTFDTDADGNVTDVEFADAVITMADTNNDGVISEDEFGPYQGLFATGGAGGEGMGGASEGEDDASEDEGAEDEGAGDEGGEEENGENGEDGGN